MNTQHCINYRATTHHKACWDDLPSSDEVAKSDDEGLVRNRLCQLMDSWAGQVHVVMSALSDYEGAVDMFNTSNRKVEFQILPAKHSLLMPAC